MLKIGDFSKFTKISIHMLRHYDEIDLLKPLQVDADSGYRYYSEEQIPYANKIQLLKTMGFGLPNIKQILNDYHNEEELKNYIESQLNRKYEEQKNLQQQIHLLRNAITSLNERKNPLTYSIIVKEIPKRLVVSYRGIISDYHQEGVLWKALDEYTLRTNVKYSIPTFDVAIIHSNDTSELIDVEVQKSIDRKIETSDNVECKEMPATKVAVVAYQGDYQQLRAIHEEMATWMIKNDYTLNGEIMNIYHISPKTTPKQEKFLTEVCFPIR
ncbi:hypothetical protein IGI37_001119 [Enterococcus sp. AZ194]|uniref:MerR family transcriptional regulator n=1 Tax=Enterococcus sp. AZ194 TaxID=2774629 RepID=UPI003F1EB6EE